MRRWMSVRRKGYRRRAASAQVSLRIAGSSSVVVSTKRRRRREVCARRTRAVRAKWRRIDRLKAVVSSCPERTCVEAAWLVQSVRSRVFAAPDWEFATHRPNSLTVRSRRRSRRESASSTRASLKPTDGSLWPAGDANIDDFGRTQYWRGGASRRFYRMWTTRGRKIRPCGRSPSSSPD